MLPCCQSFSLLSLSSRPSLRRTRFVCLSLSLPSSHPLFLFFTTFSLLILPLLPCCISPRHEILHVELCLCLTRLETICRPLLRTNPSCSRHYRLTSFSASSFSPHEPCQQTSKQEKTQRTRTHGGIPAVPEFVRSLIQSLSTVKGSILFDTPALPPPSSKSTFGRISKSKKKLAPATATTSGHIHRAPPYSHARAARNGRSFHRDASVASCNLRPCAYDTGSPRERRRRLSRYIASRDASESGGVILIS